MVWDCLWTGGPVATLAAGAATPYGIIADGAVAVEGGRIAFVGSASDLPGAPQDLAALVVDLDGRWLLPGLIDCHGHIVYGGNRADEFEQRLNGATYEDLLAAGGGILSTVRATRAADEATLVRTAVGHARRFLAEGVTTIEIKSGYGLETATEMKMLRAARRVGQDTPARVVTSFLGAHTLPPEYNGDVDGYIDLVCNDMIPAIAAEGLADAVDACCDAVGFTADQTRRVFEAARDHGLPVKLHAEQFEDAGGAVLAAEFDALSVDHLERVGEAGVAAMAAAGTVAVMLPGAFYMLKDDRVPPIDLFRRHGIPMAVATDCNPGSSPMGSLLLALNMACILFGLTPEEALAGATRHAATALGLGDRVGTLETGKAADMAVWDVTGPVELCYRLGGLKPDAVVVAGRVLESPA